MLEAHPQFCERLLQTRRVHVQQRIEDLESILGLEGNNHYYLLDDKKEGLGHVTEISSGFARNIKRWLLRHFRKFDIVIQDQFHGAMIEVQSPMKFFKVFRAREVVSGNYLGQVREVPSILYRKLVIYDSRNRKIAVAKAPRFKYWSFIVAGKKDLGRIDKKWSGIFSELFTDRDDFIISYSRHADSLDHKVMIIITALMVDIVYFEDNPGAALVSDALRR